MTNGLVVELIQLQKFRENSNYATVWMLILKVPDYLVSFVIIRHCFEEQGQGVLKWYHGIVVGALGSKEFEVIYW